MGSEARGEDFMKALLMCAARVLPFAARVLSFAALVPLAALVLPTPALADVDARLAQTSQSIEAAFAKLQDPGMVIGITDRQGLKKVMVHGYADLKAHTPMTADTRLAIGSISKAFTSIALLQLADEKRFDVHAPISRYLTWFHTQSKFPEVTGHDMMTHTSGLPFYLEDTASSRFAGLTLKDFEPTYAPGAHWRYSNTAYQLLGYVLEDIDHGQLPDIIQRRVFDPLGMSHSTAIIDDAQRATMSVSYRRWPYDGTFVEFPWFEYTAGDGAIVSTVADMSAYTRFYLNKGVGPKGRVLSEQSFAALTKPGLGDYGYGVFVNQKDGHTVISHSGGIAGFNAHIEAHMDEGFGLVFLSNARIGESFRLWVIDSVAAAFADRPAPAPWKGVPDALMTPLSDYAASYGLASEPAASRSAKLQIAVADGKLVVQRADGKKVLERMGVDAFRTVSHDDTLPYVFTRAGDKAGGKVVEVSHGSDWFVTKDFAEALSNSQKDYHELVGHYVFAGPEGPDVRVLVRSGTLMVVIGWDVGLFAQPLTPLPGGTFRLGEEDYAPERVRFDGLADGHMQRLTIQGVPLYRRETP
jgi:CubicO group peptidase (beta-lactamase class C family)